MNLFYLYKHSSHQNYLSFELKEKKKRKKNNNQQKYENKEE